MAITSGGTCLVLGGGGVAGIAWMTGVLAGLDDAGEAVTDVDLLIGTSAGSTVVAQVGSGLPLQSLVDRQTDPALQSTEIPVQLNLEKFALDLGRVLGGATSDEDRWKRIGSFALAAETVPERDRMAVIESRLPSHDWPLREIRVVAVDAESGQPRVFDRHSLVSLVAAVAASCAVPGIWPPVTIDGRRYVDGGVRSSDTADLAAGYAQVVVLAPMGFESPLPSARPLQVTVDQLRRDGSSVVVMVPDARSKAAIGTNPLDPTTRAPAVEAGREQGRRGLEET
jgi:NTE family protein